jgi:dephospho-CoA kinase
LARRVFENPADIEFLNRLIHPGVLRKCKDLIQQFQMDGNMPAIVLDMPLLIEVGWEKKCDLLIFVECQAAKRRQRTLKNGKIDEKQLKKREKFQISLDKKRKIAHYIIYNNSDESDVTEQIVKIFSSIAVNR